MLLEGWSLFDSLYMTVITLSTVGYFEVHDLSTAGRIFVMVYLALGLGVFLYGVAQVGELVVRAQLQGWMEKRRMDNTLRHLSGHFIVCGMGRLGAKLCDELSSRKLPFVVIDRDDEALESCKGRGWLGVAADATQDSVLEEVGIHRAKGLASVLASDADNLYVVLSARLLAKDLLILARASGEAAATKLKRAGANRVISLYETGATKIAQLLANPHVEEFMEVVTARGRELDLTQLLVSPTAPFANRALAETDFRKRGIIIVGIRRKNGELLLPPAGTDRVEPGDNLIALGKVDAIQSLLEKA